MQAATLALCEGIQNVKIGYTQSDEITLILTDFDERGTCQWFDGNLQKMVSVSASIATAEFNKQWLLKNVMDYFDPDLDYYRGNIYDFISGVKSAHFDSRAYTVSECWEAYNAVLWRQNDASKNSVQMVARALYSHGKLQNKKIPELHDLIVEAGQNWNNYPTDCKRGAFVVRGENGWVVDKEGPILTQDKGYFFKFVPQMEGYSMAPEVIE